MIYLLDKLIEEQNYNLEKNKFIKSVYPDAKLSIVSPPRYDPDPDLYTHYESLTVNKTYTNLLFKERYADLFIYPYLNVNFEYKGAIEVIKIYSSPNRKKLAYIGYVKHQKTIKFSKLSLNIKNDSFKESLVNDCASGIIDYVNKHKDCILDKSNLPDRLKNLLVFL